MSHNVENKLISERVARIHVDSVDLKHVDWFQYRTVNLIFLISNSFAAGSLVNIARLLNVNGRGGIEGVRGIVSNAFLVICPCKRINFGRDRVDFLASCTVKIKVPDVDALSHVDLSLDTRMLRLIHQLRESKHFSDCCHNHRCVECVIQFHF